MSNHLSGIVKLLPADWPGTPLDVLPGDLDKFAPIGLGLGGPLIMNPWDNIEDVMQRPSFYGSQAATNHPFFDAPVNDAAAGTVYFDGTPNQDDVSALLRLLEVPHSLNEYAAFVQDATRPMEQRYLVQLRIIRRWGLGSLFGIEEEVFNALPEQSLTLGELVWRFIKDQQGVWGTGMGSRQLSGAMGGDGDWAKESLAFGFMVENGYHGVYRIWSRAWLVTK